MSVRRILLIFAAAAPFAAAAALLLGHPWAAIAVLAASHLPIIYATLSPYSNWWGPVVRRFATGERQVWLTIDDGPSPDTASMLALLAEYDAAATFFVVGNKVEAAPDEVRRILSAGQSVGNHSDTHPSGSFWCLPPARVRREIERCSSAIERATGARPALFRAPVGMKNMFVHPVLQREQLTAIAWSDRGFDGTSRPDRHKVVERLTRDIRPGAILLLHEGRYDEDGVSISVAILRDLLDELRSRGYRAVLPTPASFEVTPREKTSR